MKQVKSLFQCFRPQSLQICQSLTKQECVSSVLSFVVYCAGLLWTNHFEEINMAGVLLLRPVPAFLYSVLFFLFICFRNRKKLHTLGLTTEHLKSALAFLAVVLAASLLFHVRHFLTNQTTVITFLSQAVFYLALFFFTEEFIFRGYLWPRLVKLFGFHPGTILCGTLYGLLILANPGNYHFETLTPLIFFNTLFSGIVIQYLFSLLYMKFGNIYVSTILRAGVYFFILL